MTFNFSVLGKLSDGTTEALAVEQAEEHGTRAALVIRAETTTVAVTRVSQHDVAHLQDEAEGTHLVCGSGISLQVLPAKTDFNKRLLPQAQPAVISELGTPRLQAHGGSSVSPSILQFGGKDSALEDSFFPPPYFILQLLPSHTALLSLHFCPGK